MKHSEYISIVTSLAKSQLASGVVDYAIFKLPFLATGPGNALLLKLAESLAEYMVKKGEIALFFKYIDFRTDQQAKDFEAAMLYNHTIQIIGTPEEKADAEKQLTDALRSLVNFKR